MAGCLLAIASLAYGIIAEAAVDTQQIHFNRVSMENGLSNNNARAICRDKKGFLWIATSYGLCRYDGHSVKTFYSEDMDLPTNYTYRLLIDSQERIWVGSDVGVTVYDDHLRTFTNLNKLCGISITNSISDLMEDSNGHVWFGINNQGIFSVDTRTWEARNYFCEDGVQTLPANVQTLYMDMEHGICLIALYHDNLYCCDSTLTSITPFMVKDGTQPFRKTNIQSILPDKKNSLYVSYGESSVCEINPFLNTLKPVTLELDNTTRVKDMIFADRNVLGFTSNCGIIFHDLTDGTTSKMTEQESDRYSLPGNNILCLCGNLEDGLIVGTHADGVAIQQKNKLRAERVCKTADISLTGSAVCGFAQDRNGLIWIASVQSGLFTYSMESKKLTKYISDKIPQKLSRLIADDRYIWAVSPSGIFRIDTASGHIDEYFTHKIDNYSIYRTGDGNVLIGTTLGLFEYDLSGNMFRKKDILQDKFICDMMEDSRGRMWFATFANGIYMLKDGVLANWRNIPGDDTSLPSDMILSLMEDSHGRIWMTTHGYGICRMEGNGFIRYDKTDGLPSNVVMAIEEDRSGKFWIASDSGLAMMTDEGEMVKFTQADGLLNNVFSEKASCMTSDGRILFGSRDGFIIFSPDNYVKEDSVPYIEISELKIDNRTVLPSDADSPIKCSITDTKKITLNSRQNTFGFTFSIIDKDSFGSGEVFYKLENFDEWWQSSGTDRSASYSKIPAGHYRLLIKGLGSKGNWNEIYPPLEITVKPTFMNSIWGKIIYFLGVCCIVAAIYIIARRHARERQREHDVQMKIDLNNEKLHFFTTIAHEIKTPLTLIRTPLDNIMSQKKKISDSISEDLDIIDHNTTYLTQLIGELLDFSRLEQKGYSLQCTKINLAEEVTFISHNYSQALESKGVELSIDSSDRDIPVWADKAGLAKIINNLLSNAVKHAETYIRISMTCDSETATASFCNDGQPIPLEYRKSIFDSFVQYRDKKETYTEGFGIGLSVAGSMAKLHSGDLRMDEDPTCNNFILTLPMAQNDAPIAEEAIVQTPEEIPEEEIKKGRSTVLIVEDNNELREYIRKKLDRKYNILTADNGLAAIETVRKTFRIDLIVTDISMPKMDGLELCHYLKSDFTYSHILVIILSANLTGAAKISSMEGGADMIIEKPFSLDYLTSCIDGLIHNRKQIIKNSRSLETRQDDSLDLPGLSPRDEKFIQNLDRSIMENLSNMDFNIDLLTESLKIGKTTLNRKTRDLLGCTPNDYIREKRLTKAEEMLASGADRINEICYSVGFQTPSYFIKCFKKRFGLSPNEYSKRVRK